MLSEAIKFLKNSQMAPLINFLPYLLEGYSKAMCYRGMNQFMRQKPEFVSMPFHRSFLKIVVMLAVTILYASCQEDEKARIVVRLTDSPGDYEAVNIDIQDIQVNTGDGWNSLDHVNTGVYNLLDLTDGTETVLTSSEYPAGHVTQIRLILGDSNSVVIDGETMALKTPSAQQSGLKLKVNADLIGGITYTILLDFDAARSVVHTGSDNYILKPVIRVVAKAQDGAIEGIVTPAELNVAVFAISGMDTVNSSYVPAGKTNFFVGGLPAGNYTLGFDPGELSGYQKTVLENVDVELGSVTQTGATELIVE